MNSANDKLLSIQRLRAQARRFFGELKTELSAIDDDLKALDHELDTLDTMQEKMASDIETIEQDAVERMDKELIDLLNEADEEVEYEMGMG